MQEMEGDWRVSLSEEVRRSGFHKGQLDLCKGE